MTGDCCDWVSKYCTNLDNSTHSAYFFFMFSAHSLDCSYENSFTSFEPKFAELGSCLPRAACYEQEAVLSTVRIVWLGKLERQSYWESSRYPPCKIYTLSRRQCPPGLHRGWRDQYERRPRCCLGRQNSMYSDHMMLFGTCNPGHWNSGSLLPGGNSCWGWRGGFQSRGCWGQGELLGIGGCWMLMQSIYWLQSHYQLCKHFLTLPTKGLSASDQATFN